MKRLLLVLAAGVAAVALYAATAPAGEQAVTPGQFNALKKQVTALQKDVTNLKAALGCFGLLPVTEFGDRAGTSAGYHYKQPDGNEILTSALDATAQGETPTFVMVGIDPQCLQSNSFRRLAHLAPRATR